MHPRFVDRRVALDWAACRAAGDAAGFPWVMVRDVLIEIEAGAREGGAALADDATGDEG